MFVSGLFQCAADEANVVGRTAAAAGLADDHGQVVGVVLSGKDGVHDLSDDDEGRIAGVVVYIFEAHVHSLTVVVWQHFDLVAGSLESGLQQFEMDGRHLRAEDGVGLSHLFCERHFLDGCRTDGAGLFLLLAHADRGQQGAHADAGRAQVVDFVDLQRGVDLIGTGQDIRHLVRGHGVQAAAEGVELDEIQVLGCLDIVCRRVQSGVVHPLVHDVERALHLVQVGNGILGQHGDIVGCDHFRQAVVDFRVDMVRTSGQDDAPVAGLIQEPDRLLALFTHVFAAGCQLVPCGVDGGANLTVGEAELFAQLVDQAVGDGLLALQAEEGVDEVHLAVYDGVHVVLDVLRVGGDDRAVVVVVGRLKLIPLVGNGRVEDVFHTLVDQPLHMTVGQLRRITLGFAWDGLDAQLVDLPCGSRGEHHPEAEFCEKCKPERVVLVHVQHAGDSDLAA